MEDKVKAVDVNETTKEQDELVEELSIFELDERLEFVAWCDNCSCPIKPN
jgi:hypothetical protein